MHTTVFLKTKYCKEGSKTYTAHGSITVGSRTLGATGLCSLSQSASHRTCTRGLASALPPSPPSFAYRIRGLGLAQRGQTLLERRVHHLGQILAAVILGSVEVRRCAMEMSDSWHGKK